jgi:predicted HTH transcriptional regulator
MREEEFAELLARGYEIRGIEFKGPGRLGDLETALKVTRAVLGMANLSGGGRVIIGVEDRGGSLTPTGLTDEQLESWKKYDEVAAFINEHASPAVNFDLEVQPFQGRRFVILSVYEFDEIPVLCAKERSIKEGRKDKQVLRRGACYVRSRHKPETSEIPSAEEMREVLDLAIDKGLRKFVARARAAGLFPTGSTATGDEEQFNKQIGDLS